MIAAPVQAQIAARTTGQPAMVRALDVSQQSFKKSLLLLILLGCVIRIGYFVEHSHTPSFAVPTLDQKYYDTVAKMLLAGEDLRQLHGFKPLLYPMCLAALYRIAGGAALPLAIVVQHCLGVATGLIVALLSARLFRNRLAGLIAGAIYLLAPLPLMFEGELLVESSYTFLICLGLLVHVKAADRSCRGNEADFDSDASSHSSSTSLPRRLHASWLWLLGGSLTVLAAQMRPNILVFLAIYPLTTLWLWLSGRHQRRIQTGSSINLLNLVNSTNSSFVPLLGLIGALCMALLWGFINLKQSPHFHLLPSAGGVNLYLGNKRGSKGITAEQEKRISYSDRYQDAIEVWARQEYVAAMQAQGQTPQDDPMAVSRYWTRRALSEIRADPASWAGLMAKKTWLMLWNTEIPNNKTFAFFQQESLWLKYLPIRWVLLLLLVVPGIGWAATRGSRDALFLLSAFLLLYFAGNIAFFISDRYRYPMWPAMAVLASGAVPALWQLVASRNVRAIGLCGIGMFLAATISLPNWGRVQLPTFARDYLFRSIAWYEKGHFPEALKDVERSLALDPSDPSALQQRGILLFALDRHLESKASFEQALKLSPGEAVTWNNLGVVNERLGETNQAMAAFASATACDPPSRNAFINLACLQIRLSLLAEAQQTVLSLEKISSSPNATTLALKSVLASRTGNTAAAASLQSQALSRDKDASTWIFEKTSTH